MESALLYTFSTIAQALGGAFALLAAFVLYRFQTLDALIEKDSDDVASVFTEGTLEHRNYEALRAERNYRAAWRVVKKVADDLATIKMRPFPAGPAAFHRLDQSIARHQQVSNWFRGAAFLSGALVVGSVAVIPFAQVLHEHTTAACVVLAVGVFAFAACAFVYWRVIDVAIGLPKSQQSFA